MRYDFMVIFVIIVGCVGLIVIINEIFYIGLKSGIEEGLKCCEWCAFNTPDSFDCIDFCLIKEWFNENWKYDINYTNETIEDHLFG